MLRGLIDGAYTYNLIKPFVLTEMFDWILS